MRQNQKAGELVGPVLSCPPPRHPIKWIRIRWWSRQYLTTPVLSEKGAHTYPDHLNSISEALRNCMLSNPCFAISHDKFQAYPTRSTSKLYSSLTTKTKKYIIIVEFLKILYIHFILFLK